MKTLFTFLIIFLSSSFTYANEDISILSNEVKMCTMDYTPVCGINGTTYGNACSAGENKIAYKGECNNYVNNSYYTILQNKYSPSIKKNILNYDSDKLIQVLEKIDIAIENVKKSKISLEMQKNKITTYIFLKNIIPEIVEFKSNSIKDITFSIEGEKITLNNGISKINQSTTRYFGNEVFGDFNNDEMIDTAFLVTQDNGGSETFYYVVALLKTQNGYVGTNAILLGDRIAPQTSNYMDGKIIVNYATRKDSEPMTTSPSIGVSKYFKITNDKLVEINN
ncbi:MAG: Kazal-type serine protease inhibitor family protein [Candidatus Gracilibacteria bacterium]|nr:Kazal-type serine protease inhibitor family protein [Candidatus Gracilibacteria bacterium]